MFDLTLEQPIFGANSIKGKVRGQSVFSFELKFVKGGAIEFGQAMFAAAKQAANIARQTNFQAPPSYTATASDFYQAPEGAYQPSYPVGFTLPTQIFNEAPPPGFVYATQAPPPYPGLVNPQTGPANNNYTGPTSYGIPGFSTGSTEKAKSYPTQPSNPHGNLAPYDTSGAFGQNPNSYGTNLNSHYPNLYGNGSGPGFFATNASNLQSSPHEHPPSYDEAIKKKQ